ncbi:diaminopropionate ammonia-lyase [Buttiauxella sp. A111]|uniref:diaminopropionate ammonia-lyase n=1 Tax=Buttiauxella sp. A111 TaxID=2563088 RepID=UPI0010EAF02E|nr:diaminopropionate ammonia-lyase [Buttiauxella sp. A111]GDX03874.1 diaminopropionate ammonia-lyase [Buttiauxella sp. A111]
MSRFSIPMKIADNSRFNGESMALFSREPALQAKAFHQQLPGYQPTPLHSLSGFANQLGVANVWVKDESQRFGLNAFKMLGGAYAIARLYCEKYHLDIQHFSFEKCRNAKQEKMTFATTTDGNHGRGVAWAAKELGQHAVIYMPKGSSQERVDHITRLGAECIVTDMNYDDTVRLTMRTAAEHGWEVVQDTAWEGYTQIPTWIMQGYATLAVEAVEQMPQPPTHVFLQAGVGAMAAGVLGYLVDVYGAQALHSVIVEPERADCIYRSGCSGTLSVVGGEMNTIMAGLACGEPNPLGWPLLRNCSHQFISCDDRVAALGMRVLGNPLLGDAAIISGESGAVTMGVLAAVMFHPEKNSLMQRLGLNEQSRVLLISTEGDTDVQHYREVVWEGKHSISGCNNQEHQND